MREKQIEQKLVQAVKAKGGICPKFVSPGWNAGQTDSSSKRKDGICRAEGTWKETKTAADGKA